MTLTLIKHVRHAELRTIPARRGTKVFALAAEFCRRLAIKRKLSRLKQRDLQDIGLTPTEIDLACSRPLAQDAATELYTQAWLR